MKNFCLSIINHFKWGTVPNWLSLILAAVTIFVTALHFKKQPREEVHPQITISNNNVDGKKDESKIMISFWAVNKSNIPISLAFQGVKRNNAFDRLGNEFCYDYLEVNQTTRLYNCSLKEFKHLFSSIASGQEKMVFGFVNEINEVQLSRPINMKELIEKIY